MARVYSSGGSLRFQRSQEAKEEHEGLVQGPTYQIFATKLNEYGGSSIQKTSKSQILLLILISILLSVLLYVWIAHFRLQSKGAVLLKLPSEEIPKQLDNQLKVIMHDLNAIKSNIAEVNSKIESEEVRSSSEINSLKSIISSNGASSVKGNDVSHQKQKIEEEGSFEAAFLREISGKTQQSRREESQVLVGQDYILPVPKIIWAYSRSSFNFLDQLYIKNNRYWAKKEGYEYREINELNFNNFITVKSTERVTSLIKALSETLVKDINGNLKYHYDEIVRQFIMLSVLFENGGIMMDGGFAITEDLGWVRETIRNKYVNRGNRGVRPQVVGFYSPYYSLPKNKENIVPFEGMEEVDKYMTLFPSMERYFIAAEKNAVFLSDLIGKINEMLLNPDDFVLNRRSMYKLTNMKGSDIYYEYFTIAVQTILQDKQREIDGMMRDGYRHFAIDFYGLNLINCYYGPYKLHRFWKDDKPHKAFYSMSQYTAQQFYSNIGPIKYIAKITPEKEIGELLVEALNRNKIAIMKGSFIQEIFYPEFDGPLVQNTQKPLKSEKQWTSLPKIIWVFWDKGLSSAGISNQICVENLRRMGKQSGFQLNEVNLTNIGQYLEKETIQKINNALLNSKLNIYPQSIGDLYRLALLAKHGGVYLDASYIALQNFDWLVNIGQYPSQYIFNRFGDLPKVLMFWHPHYGSPHQWQISRKSYTKSQWHLAYENNFIAAQKDNELIIEWFNLLLQFYGKTYTQVYQVFQDSNMVSNKWITNNWHYLLAMDTIKCVVGRREVALTKANDRQWQGASDYYKIWSMSGYLGQQKFRSNANFQSPGSQDNVFAYRYSQQYVQGLIGKIRHLTKFYSVHSRELSTFISTHMNGNFTGDAHSQSVFMRHMWNSDYSLRRTKENLMLEVE